MIYVEDQSTLTEVAEEKSKCPMLQKKQLLKNEIKSSLVDFFPPDEHQRNLVDHCLPKTWTH